MYKGPSTEIGFNAQYMVDFLRAVGTDDVTFHFKDAHSAGELRPGGEGAPNYRYVIMPMRI
jgi:DNA polymerase-3 subunit beta